MPYKAASLYGYATSWLTNGSAFKYRPNNNFVSGNMNYAAGSPTAVRKSLAFSAAPADLSTISVPDTPAILFTFTWGGSPGAGVIPLVGGGGTAAQAATATAAALQNQLSEWTVTNPSAGNVLLVSQRRGISITLTLGGVTNIVITTTGPSFALVVPGRFGKVGCVLPA